MKKNLLINSQTVEHVAKLANLELSQQELKTYTDQLQEVLEYMEKLAQVNTDGIEPTFQTISSANVWREDKVEPGLSQRQALVAAEKTHQGYFVAKSVFGGVSAVKGRKKIGKRKQIDEHNAVLTEVEVKGLVGHKDLFVTEKVETTAGSKVLAGYLPQYSATVVKRLEKAGYKTKFKLNQDAWGHGSSGENSDFGPTKNPWDMNRVPGGSSSGSGVVVALGKVEVATGTDTCGSIRMPAGYTNTCGIKPTYGAVSRYGVIAFASSLDCPGLLAQSVTKLRQFFNIIAGSDLRDATSQHQLKETEKKSKVKTIGLPKEFFTKGIDSRVKKLVLEAAQVLKKDGFEIKDVSLPNAEYGIAAYYVIAPTETSSNLARYDGIRYGQDRSYFGAEAKRRIMLGSFVSSAGYTDKYYEKAARVRTLIINDFKKLFAKVDAILAPISPIPPFLLGEKTGDPLQMYLTDIYAAPASLAGLPSLAVPCGFTLEGLPTGMQLIGPQWSEEMLFDIGETYQRLTNWHKKKPKL